MALNEITDSTINALFTDAMTNPAAREKVAAATELYIRDKIRESAFCRKILPPQPITREECDRNEHNQSLKKIIDIETGATAVSLNMNSQANTRYITGDRFAINFHKVSSDEYTISEGDLMGYEMPITKIIEKNCVKAIEEVEDNTFMAQMENIVASTGKALDIAMADPTIDGKKLVTLFNLLESGDKLETSVLLMSRATWNDWTGQGPGAFDSKSYDVLVGGYTEETIYNKRVIITNKDDLVKHNDIWAFAAPEFLGRFYTLNDVKFWTDVRAEYFHFKAWEHVGLGIGNTKGIAKISLVPQP